MNPYVAPGIEESDHVLDAIERSVCQEVGVERYQLRGRSRIRDLAWSRHIFCHLAFRYTGRTSNYRIAGHIGRHYTTATNCGRKAKELLEVDPEFRELYEHVEENLKNRLQWNSRSTDSSTKGSS
jgi:chromosomal replication initiation ATPase DnaA